MVSWIYYIDDDHDGNNVDVSDRVAGESSNIN
jgi:hypothetical protein